MNWYRKSLMKVSWNSGIPLMEDPDARTRDPYKPRKNVTDNNPTERTRLGDEEGLGGGFGSRMRGEGMPTEISPSFDNMYEEQADLDIPTDEAMIGDPGLSFGVGPDSETFADPVDQPETINRIDERNREPVGPHNMQSKLHKNVFDFVATRQRR